MAVKVEKLTNQTLPVEVTLSTGDKLQVEVKRYGITVVDQAKQQAAAAKLSRGEMSEEEFTEQTCYNVQALVAGWDLMQDDNSMYPLDTESLSKLPAFLLDEIVTKIIESLTFRRQK